ncbi:CHAT domain-containing protein [Dyadobacter sp. CY261]|uniref:CHAT domain-containing protein n=1 Tax=Dyadobacter sp. CY261 TaxID=2907203 RepID=UPI001F2645CE|nr:CHAT domain-containing protein [Dyadobacter sp. CY261]MCF0069315.1 CHAT domain-containing protein [Dyadobacter sp. CY261]
MKVILLAFANSANAPLEHLTAEDKEVYTILNERHYLSDYIVHKESFATPDDLNRCLAQYQDDLAIFHFSGHADRDKLFLSDEVANSSGIAHQLQYCARNGVLKMVVLNGCSTGGQVEDLLKCGVPVVVSTSAPVNDKSAKAFSVRFWELLVRTQSTIEKAFLEALGPAKTVANGDIGPVSVRGLLLQDAQNPAGKALWRLDGDPNILASNPVPYKSLTRQELPKPNEKLIDTLYNSFHLAGNPKIVELHKRETRETDPEPVSKTEKQIAILNTIPFPIGIHLQKLIASTASNEEGYDDYDLKRLTQITQVYQITTEFLGIIMIAQIWEVYVRFPNTFELDHSLKDKLREYLSLTSESREVYDFTPLIQQVRAYLDNLAAANSEYELFIDEQNILTDLFLLDENFRNSCERLRDLRKIVFSKKANPDRVIELCVSAEEYLCNFLRPLGFVHRYHLTSVQSIDVLKLRHITKDLVFRHRIIKFMQALGTNERNYYNINSFLDNWGVILLKCKMVAAKVKYKSTIQYDVQVIDYLNLSPFVIDYNSFVEKADLSYIMFFKGENEAEITFKRVKEPLSKRDEMSVPKLEDDSDNFYPIREQFNAFKRFIA